MRALRLQSVSGLICNEANFCMFIRSKTLLTLMRLSPITQSRQKQPRQIFRPNYQMPSNVRRILRFGLKKQEAERDLLKSRLQKPSHNRGAFLPIEKSSSEVDSSIDNLRVQIKSLRQENQLFLQQNLDLGFPINTRQRRESALIADLHSQVNRAREAEERAVATEREFDCYKSRYKDLERDHKQTVEKLTASRLALATEKALDYEKSQKTKAYQIEISRCHSLLQDFNAKIKRASRD